jgi:hypothetical protein
LSESEKNPLAVPSSDHLEAARFDMLNDSSRAVRPGSDDSDSKEKAETELAPNQITNQRAGKDQEESETYQELQAELFGKPADDILACRLSDNL